MKPTTIKTNLRTALKWVLWAFLVQLILINISAAFYGYKLTHFYEPATMTAKPASKNIFAKTWRLFTGPRFEKTLISEIPHFPFETIQFYTKSNIRIEAWFMPVDSSKGTIIMFHGLGLNKSSLIDQAYEFRYFGFNVMLVDLRAHGNSSGNTTTLGFCESEEVKLAYEIILKKGEKKIFLYGISLGAVVVAKAMHDYGLGVSGIILDAPFGSLRKHLQARARMLGFSTEPFGTLFTFWSGIQHGINGFKHNTCSYAESINCPVLMQYGALDSWVLPEETNSIYQHIASGNKKLVIYENADHEFYLRKDITKWREEIEVFFNKTNKEIPKIVEGRLSIPGKDVKMVAGIL